MEITRDFMYNKSRMVLLVCDFYETSQIPVTAYEIIDNLALFPVANLPIIEYILSNLYAQDFKHVIISGKNIDSVLKYIDGSRFKYLMNIRSFRCNGSCLGDIFRSLDELNYEINNMVVMYGNHFSNVPLKKLLKKHKKSNNNLLTVFAHENYSNDVCSNLYVNKSEKIVHFEKNVSKSVDSDEMQDLIKNHKSVTMSSHLSAPTFAVLASEVPRIFTENFDYRNLTDLMVGILAAGVFNFDFQLVTPDDFLNTQQDICQLETTEVTTEIYQDGDSISTFITESVYNTPLQLNSTYSKEVNTLLDYFNFNLDVLQCDASLFGLASQPESLKGSISSFDNIQNSVVGSKSHVYGTLKNCIVWDNCDLTENYYDQIIFSDNSKYSLFHLNVTLADTLAQSAEGQQTQKKNETFFDDINDYLTDTLKIHKPENINLTNVFKQISLMRIVWNASRSEFLEAFAYFLAETIDENKMEESMSLASVFFGVLDEYCQTEEDQEVFMQALHDILSEYPLEVKTQIFFNYAFLLVDDGIIDKSLVKKYTKMHKNGLF